MDREPVSGVREGHLQVSRTARYWVAGADVSTPGEVWYVLHGYAQLARRFLRRFEGLADGTRWVVAPEGLSRFYTDRPGGRHGPSSRVGATWMTREDRIHEIRDYVHYLDALQAEVSEGLHGEAPTTVLGFSQGVATACRWVTMGRVQPGRLILWGDFLPPDLDLDRARDTARHTRWITVRGTADPALDDPSLASAESERLEAGAVQVRRVTYEGGHEIDPRVLERLAGEEA